MSRYGCRLYRIMDLGGSLGGTGTLKKRPIMGGASYLVSLASLPKKQPGRLRWVGYRTADTGLFLGVLTSSLAPISHSSIYSVSRLCQVHRLVPTNPGTKPPIQTGLTRKRS